MVLYHCDMESTKRPPNDRGQGRKRIKAGEETVTFSMRVAPSQQGKIRRNGGAKWVRALVDKAPDERAKPPKP